MALSLIDALLNLKWPMFVCCDKSSKTSLESDTRWHTQFLVISDGQRTVHHVSLPIVTYLHRFQSPQLFIYSYRLDVITSKSHQPGSV